jgi:hypothetical protein
MRFLLVILFLVSCGKQVVPPAPPGTPPAPPIIIPPPVLPPGIIVFYANGKHIKIEGLLSPGSKLTTREVEAALRSAVSILEDSSGPISR